MEKEEIGRVCLAIFRILLGWYFLWAFFDKMFGLGFQTPAGSGFIDGGSPSSFVIYVADGLLKDFYDSLAGNTIVDIVLLLGLLVLGVTLILGITSKLTTFGTSLFLLVMFSLHIPPTDNPIIDHRVIMMAGMVVTYYLGGFEKLSLYEKWKELSIVKKFPILE